MIIDDEKLVEFEELYNAFWREHGVGGSPQKTDFCAGYNSMLDELRKHRKPDRSALLRMAGNIASGLADATYAVRGCLPQDAREQIAEDSVDIARRILALVDGAKP